MDKYSLTWTPYFPVSVVAGLAILSLIVLFLGFYRRARGSVFRAVFVIVALVSLINPSLRDEQRQPLPDVALVVVDRSPSQRLAKRDGQVDDAAKDLTSRLSKIPNLQLRQIELDGDADGTKLNDRLAEALGEIDKSRIGAVIAVTDGQIHDAPGAGDEGTLQRQRDLLGTPLHVLLTGRPDEQDRQLTIEQAPTYVMVGQDASITVRVTESPSGSDTVPVILRQDGKQVAQIEARPGQPATIPFRLDKAGPAVLEAEAAVRPGELTALNNRAIANVNGVRDRLRVLLVSGEPYPGLRVWRNLLKADPAVDLVHFTILRPPEKQDGTPIRELALIAFPSRELFEVKLNEFDLVIFDRYNRRGLLPLAYLDNIANYVEHGGALLEATGPEFASPTSLFRTPLSRILPGRPSGEVFEREFKPHISELGQRHPVTQGLAPPDGDPSWGDWFRQVDVEAGGAQVVMTGVADRPLLALARMGQGRVAQLLSDHAWLWARGFQEGGPQAALLRRLVHWLMKEPELEEERLEAGATADGIRITRHTIGQDPIKATITAPDGTERTVSMQPDAAGVARASVVADQDGLYKVSDGDHAVYVEPHPIAARELADIRATADRLAPLATATGGSVNWLYQDGVPDIRTIAAGRRMEGRGWIGIRQNGAYNVTGSSDIALIPPWLALLLLAGAIAGAWWAEGRSA
ncbi:hypothetical protein SAMN07250955_104264 [Arboricoccus pini]|uniref:Glutamine amidotransferase domain-containing protein n=1 Tax=Arboricoccus pini TaxID=1963835 RepID=A0A212R0C5_9PROT|nr:hypothetical protein [Arboricoccus pini]SNB65433.1 hypothetical protein SAMN07250955_104264 [Arboricoccus pini]